MKSHAFIFHSKPITITSPVRFTSTNVRLIHVLFLWTFIDIFTTIKSKYPSTTGFYILLLIVSLGGSARKQPSLPLNNSPIDFQSGFFECNVSLLYLWYQPIKNSTIAKFLPSIKKYRYIGKIFSYYIASIYKPHDEKPVMSLKSKLNF